MFAAENNPHEHESGVGRYAPAIKWVSIALIAISLLLILRHLPIGAGIEAMQGWIEGLGLWGPVVYGLLYVVAVVLLVPASALTLAAGLLFGLVGGTIVVSLASTTGAALAFLIARHLARERVAKQVAKYPKFHAIDNAVAEGGWKIVALLRLSPAVPFNLQNYLYGLTRIRFWTCVLTSWVAMLPGTFMYVYLGYIGRAGLEATGAEGQGRTTGEWIMLIVGLLATIAVTVYVTRLARKSLKKHTDVDEGKEESTQETEQRTEGRGSLRGALFAALLAIVAMGAATYVQLNPDKLTGAVSGLFGPPQATLKEAYVEKTDGASFDHSQFDQLLKTHVDENGWVDYEGLKTEAATLDSYIETVANAPFDELGRNEKLALLINAYNAFTLRLILDYRPLESIQDIPGNKRWDDERWNVGGNTWSLNQIEHQEIRPKFQEPRIHFALVCAAVGCPPLRSEAYVADKLDKQLEDQTIYAHTHDRWFRYEPGAGKVGLTSLYKWYGGDFEQVAGSVLDYAARYSPELHEYLKAGNKPSIDWLHYDWSLNSHENAP